MKQAGAGCRATCALCHQHRTLVESHILSEFLYDEVYDPVKHRFHRLHTDPSFRNDTRPKGIYERLNCLECEAILSVYEDYAAKVFKGGIEIGVEARPDRIVVHDVSYKEFKLFQLSLLWRCSVSRMPEFAAVDLGPHEDAIRQLLKNGTPGEPHSYGCLMMIPELYDVVRKCLMPPVSVQFQGHRSYCLLAKGFWWVFVVSNHSETLPEKEYFLSAGDILTIVRERGSTQFMMELARDLVRNPTFPRTL